MFDILSKDMKCKINVKEIANFNLKSLPYLFLVSCISFHFLFIKNRNVWNKLNKVLIWIKLCSCIFHTNPILMGCLLFGSYSKLFKIMSKINSWISDNMFFILKLNKKIITNYWSYVQSICRWCIQPLGIVFNCLKSLVFLA